MIGRWQTNQQVYVICIVADQTAGHGFILIFLLIGNPFQNCLSYVINEQSWNNQNPKNSLAFVEKKCYCVWGNFQVVPSFETCYSDITNSNRQIWWHKHQNLYSALRGKAEIYLGICNNKKWPSFKRECKIIQL